MPDEFDGALYLPVHQKKEDPEREFLWDRERPMHFGFGGVIGVLTGHIDEFRWCSYFPVHQEKDSKRESSRGTERKLHFGFGGVLRENCRQDFMGNLSQNYSNSVPESWWLSSSPELSDGDLTGHIDEFRWCCYFPVHQKKDSQRESSRGTVRKLHFSFGGSTTRKLHSRILWKIYPETIPILLQRVGGLAVLQVKISAFKD
ncbi:hypothetical protein CDAR_49501 [Caerostris darwini]|uniref:Uncharacterized protein n=1 Tax=Caerostris darwini TaxID=1538125 RepID=A0AAV4VL30_9ARAC|nr:hypothetical protein CDAR_49501 [Caerostris darwini]